MFYYLNYLLNKILYYILHKIKPFKKINTCIWCKKKYFYKPRKRNHYFCSKKCKNKFNKEKYQQFKHNNRCKYHKFEKLTFKNICWGCYKEEFKYQNNKINIFLRLKFLFNGFKIIPTFRTSEDSWAGDKIAFEQFLKDLRVKWFVYVKFYQNKKGKIKPLVVGKSGSVYVNYSGSDLNFSVNIKHGPARQFLAKYKCKWYYDFIAIKKCHSEAHAYKIERKIANKFKLFTS